MMQITRQQNQYEMEATTKRVEYDELDTARGTQLQCQFPLSPSHLPCCRFRFQIPYENEIFIGRLCFRYISWIVINFIDNCHILMAWLCAWLSDCCSSLSASLLATLELLQQLLLRAWHMHTANSFFAASYCFFPCLFVANCFQRKLLHAQSYEQTDEEGDGARRGKGALGIYMYVYRSGWQAFAVDCASSVRHVKNSKLCPMRQSELEKIRKSLLMGHSVQEIAESIFALYDKVLSWNLCAKMDCKSCYMYIKG